MLIEVIKCEPVFILKILFIYFVCIDREDIQA